MTITSRRSRHTKCITAVSRQSVIATSYFFVLASSSDLAHIVQYFSQHYYIA